MRVCVLHQCEAHLTFADLLVKSLQQDVLIYVLDVDEVGVVIVDGFLKTLQLLIREPDEVTLMKTQLCVCE